MVYNEDRGTLAFACSDVRYGMESNKRTGTATTRHDIGGPNAIRLEYNQCGCVYEVGFWGLNVWGLGVRDFLDCSRRRLCLQERGSFFESCTVSYVCTPIEDPTFAVLSACLQQFLEAFCAALSEAGYKYHS